MQDEDVVVVHKPAGLLVHRSSIAREVQEFALQRVRDQLGAHVFPVHRLDRPTSGALLFARSAEMARDLSAQFAHGLVEKSYLAVVRGVPKEERQLVDYPLREELDRVSDRRARVDKPAQAAQTEIEVCARCELKVAVDRYPTSRYALVRARPLTGRKHQVRRHLRHIGHPIIGDVNHGSGKHNRFFAEQFGVRRLFLACCELRFTHPRSGLRVHVKAPLCADFHKVVQALGWEANV
jgi:tRNA pseudouridine65 synthase